MAIDLGRASITMMPDWSHMNQASVNRQMGKLNAEVGVITKKGDLDKITRQFKAEGTKAGDGFTRGADGKLRGAGDRFVKAMDFNGVTKKAGTSGAEAGRKFGNSMEREAKQSAGNIGKSFKAALGPMMALAAGAGIGNIVSNSIGEARESQKVGAVTQQIIKSTGGAAKVSAEQVGDLATAISNKTGIDDEQIQSSANLLLTFKNVKNEVGNGADIFNRATQAAQDMSAAGFGDSAGAAKMLGKALNDPIKGITALGRAGVTFSAEQKEQIKNMVKSGDTLGAQKMIMKEVESQVGGVAAASTTATEKLQVMSGNLQEQFGTMLLPYIDKFANFLMEKALPAVSRFFDWLDKGAGGSVKKVKEVIDGVKGVTDILFKGDFNGKPFGLEEDSGFVDILFRIREAGLEVVDWFKADLWPSIKATAATFRDAFSRIATIVGQFVAGVWARIEPMMPKIKQIFGTIGGIITDELELVRAIVTRVLGVVQDIWDRWGNQIMGFVAFMFKHIWGLISGALTIIRGIIKTVTGLISGDWGKVWEGIKTIASGAMELVRTLIQSIMGAIKGIWETSTSFLSRKWGELWGGVKDKTHEVMNSVRDKVKSVTDGLGGAFSGAVTAIGKAWDKVQSVTAKPVNFVIGTVYNNGIRKFINAIISLFGGTELSPIGEISSGGSGGGGGSGRGPLKMKDGGVLPGHTPGRDVHRFISATGGTLDLSGGETILRPEFTQAVGSGWVKGMNSIARSGGSRAVAEALSHGHFKDGGILGSLKGAAKWVGNAMTGGVDKIGDILEMMVNLPNTISSWKKQINDNKGPAKFGEVFGKAASGTVDRAKQWIQDAAGRIGVGGGGGGLPVASFNPGGTVSVGGSLLDSSTYAKVMAAQKLAGMAFNITQGSYRPATSYSGTTHTGGGALDIVGGNLQVINAALRQTGFASWIRNPSQGPWPWHIHALEMGNSKLSQSAAAQVQSYLAGGNGLGGYSRGVQAAAPGWAMIDENGDEWVNFRGGERVLPNGVSPVAGTQQFVGTMRITNWQEGMVELKGEFVDEMDWRENR